MFGELNQEQINQVLRTGVVGRIGCHVIGKTYIIPISYVYDDESVYARNHHPLSHPVNRENRTF